MEDKREKAREKFTMSGLCYADIKEADFYMLLSLLVDEIEDYSKAVKDPNTHGISTMFISKRLKRNIPIFNEDSNGKLKSAFIKVSSHYFEGREAISFNQDGFIGFAGWADDTNVLPFVNAFNRFTDYLKAKKQKAV